MADGYSDYIYQGDTDWLSRETWHAYSTGNTFDILRYHYTNGRPDYEDGTLAREYPGPFTVYYMQYNWHGDASMWVGLDGNGSNNTSITFDPWGVYPYNPPDYYMWNARWGYLYFSTLKLYYVHGRWYNPETGLWLSPNEKGDYLYGGDGQDPVNFASLGLPPISDSGSEPVNSSRWIVNFLKRNSNQIKAAANRHNLLPEFLGAVLYLENNSNIDDLFLRISDLPFVPNEKDRIWWAVNFWNPLSDSGSGAYIEVLSGRETRILSRTQGLGAIKPDVGAHLEELGLLYNPFTGVKSDFPNARDAFASFAVSLPRDVGSVKGIDIQAVGLRSNPLARFGTLRRLSDRSWGIEYLAADLDSARLDTAWPDEAPKNDRTSELAMRAMYIYHYNVGNFTGFSKSPEQFSSAAEWKRVRGFIPQISTLLYSSGFQ